MPDKDRITIVFKAPYKYNINQSTNDYNYINMPFHGLEVYYYVFYPLQNVQDFGQ